jgi:hypothetical protein
VVRVHGPRFRILDIVEMADEPDIRGVITEVTRHADDEIKYSVLPLTDDPDYVGCVYPESWLTGTGQRASVQMFALPDGLREGDVVRITTDCGYPEYAGKTGVLSGSSSADGSVGFWIEELGESAALQPQFLVPTGERIVRANFEPHEVVSTSVTEDGMVTGHSQYLILDSLDNYLSEAGL